MKKLLSKVKIPSNITKNLIEYGTATILIAVVVWFFLNRNISQTNAELKEKIDITNTAVTNIQGKIDSIREYQDILYYQTWQLQKAQDQTIRMIDKSNNLLRENQIKLEKIRLDYNEKINSVRNYNFVQLDSFFTDRYK